jgi:hypothetical protein
MMVCEAEKGTPEEFSRHERGRCRGPHPRAPGKQLSSKNVNGPHRQRAEHRRCERAYEVDKTG